MIVVEVIESVRDPEAWFLEEVRKGEEAIAKRLASGWVAEDGKALIARAKVRYEGRSFDEKLDRVLRFARDSVRVGQIKDELAALRDAVKYVAWYGSTDERVALEAAALNVWMEVAA